MGQVEIVDLERAVMLWLNEEPGLCGRGNPVENGFHTGVTRSPGQGAIGSVEVGLGSVSDAVDQRRVLLRLKSVGRAGPESKGPRWECERAARATARRFLALDAPVQVALGDGSYVTLLHVDATSAQGPTLVGDVGGEITYAIDAVVTAQER